MGISDDSFREAFKPLHIPAHYSNDDTDEQKVIYALAQLGESTARGVALKLKQTDEKVNEESFFSIAEYVLASLYHKGLIKGVETGNEIQYNLSKITEANDGRVDPELLAPGLD